MKRPGALFFAPAVVIIVVVLAVFLNKVSARMQASKPGGSAIAFSIPEPEAALVDQNGRPFRLQDQRGKGVVLLFGYAHCPDVCPTTLAKLMQADRLLGGASRNLTVAFVTVDPRRDTVPALKKYVDLFDPHFYGLTGSTQALGAYYAAYHVWHQRLPNHGSAAGYLMAHTSAIYMLDRNGAVRAIHDWTDTPAVLARDMKALLG